MMRLLREPSRKTVLAVLVLVSLVLMALPARCSRRICYVVQPMLAPLGEAGMRLTTHVRSRVNELTGRARPGDDAEVVAFMTAVRQHIESQHETIARLRKWRSTLGEFPCKLIDAVVVGAEGLALRDRRLLDAGRARGVAPGDLVTTRRLLHEFVVALPLHLTVLGRNYVVGRIIDSGAHTATLQLVTDPEFEMQANLWRIVQPGGQRVIYVDPPGGGRVKRKYAHDGRPGPYPVGRPIPVLVQGDGRQIVLRDVPAKHEILPGDILTSSQSTRLLLPFGLTVGRVRRSEPDRKHAHAVSVFVEPLADLELIRHVYVVMPLERSGGDD